MLQIIKIIISLNKRERITIIIITEIVTLGKIIRIIKIEHISIIREIQIPPMILTVEVIVMGDLTIQIGTRNNNPFRREGYSVNRNNVERNTTAIALNETDQKKRNI